MLLSGNDCYIAIENGPTKIVDLPIKIMVDLSSSLCVNVDQAGLEPWCPIKSSEVGAMVYLHHLPSVMDRVTVLMEIGAGYFVSLSAFA